MQSLNLLGKQAVVAMHFYDSLTLRQKASSVFGLMLVNSKNDSDSVLCDVIIIYLNKWLEHSRKLKTIIVEVVQHLKVHIARNANHSFARSEIRHEKL